MDRRLFLALSALAASACVQGASPAGPRANLPGARSFPHPELEEAGIGDLAARMSRGELSARDLVDRYLARIEAIDRAGPTLRSVIEVNPDAAAIATRLDEERRAKG